jgi:exosome complex RNA-binding protein Csl4
MKCKKCGAGMKKVDERTMKCEKCGNVETIDKKASTDGTTK